jgi:hypothetical protein
MAGLTRMRERGFAPFMLVGAAFFAVVWIVRGERHLAGLYGPHEYWASQWATDYGDGFVNRGLLGEIIRRLGIDNANYLFITLASWAVSLVLFAVIMEMLWGLVKQLEAGARICLLAAVVISPAVAGMLIETMGDPLQVLLLVHILLAQHLLAGRSRPLAVGAVYALFGVAMALVHEASIFFFVPWLGIQAFIVQKTANSRAALIGNCLTSVITVAVLVARGFSAGGMENPVIHLGDQDFIYEGRLAPPFMTLLQEETARMFGSGLPGYVKTALRIAGATALPVVLAGLLTAARIGTGAGATRQWRTYALAFFGPAICLGPLMLIAHDWGRFFSYELILFLLTLSALKPHESDPGQRAAVIMFPLAGSLVLAGLTTTAALREYRVNGLDADPHILAACGVVIGVFAVLTFVACKHQTSS